MRTVWKYELKPLNSIEREALVVGQFEIPLPAQILTAEYLQGMPVLWVVVNDSEFTRDEKALVTVYSVGTGHGQVPTNSFYLNTLQDGAFVWHLFYTKQGG